MNEILAATVRELANAGWHAFQAVNGAVPESESLQPGWAPGPLLKSRERTKPPLGWPRETDSLCPRCVVETRNAIIRGERDLAELVNGRVGEALRDAADGPSGVVLLGLEGLDDECWVVRGWRPLRDVAA